jgi:hypothetical protein
MMIAANTDLAVALAEMEITDRKVRAVHVNREVATGAAREILDLQRVVSARAPSVWQYEETQTSTLPPCSRGGIVRAPSASTLSKTSLDRSWPTYAPCGSGGKATGGTALACSAMSPRSRLFHVASSSCDGAVPIKPGCDTPAKRTPGMCREEA